MGGRGGGWLGHEVFSGLVCFPLMLTAGFMGSFSVLPRQHAPLTSTPASQSVCVCVCVRRVCVCACGSYRPVLSLCPTSVSHPRSLSNPGLWLAVVMALHFCNWLKCDFSSKIGRPTHHLAPQLVVMSSPPFVLPILACAFLSGCVCLLLCLYPLLLVESLTAMLLFFLTP